MNWILDHSRLSPTENMKSEHVNTIVQCTPPRQIRHRLDCLVVSGGRCELGISQNQGCGTTQTSQWFRFRFSVFFTGSSSGSDPAQQAKTTRLRLSTRCFPGRRTLCTNWLHTGADLIQGIVSYVRIKTGTLKISSARH